MRRLLLTDAFLAIPIISLGDSTIHVALEGKWAGNAADGTKITYTFSKDGSVIWDVGEPNFQKQFPRGLPGKYKIRVAEPFWELDITDFNDPQFKAFKFLAIIKIINAKTIRMEGNPGKRPKEFGKDAIEFRPETKP